MFPPGGLLLAAAWELSVSEMSTGEGLSNSSTSTDDVSCVGVKPYKASTAAVGSDEVFLTSLLFGAVGATGKMGVPEAVAGTVG